jgi:ethanolamine utilization protein EutA
VDIGSTTTQFVLSRIRLGLTSGRYVVLASQTLRESEIRLTPYDAGSLIDATILGDWIEQQYAAAAIHRDEVDTGVVLLTGNALSKANSLAIATLFADSAGTFVSVAAGHQMEAALAARGSGALGISRLEDSRILHIDIGGGTTKYAICDGGVLVATAAVDVGARLVEVSEGGRVVRLQDQGRSIAESLGLELVTGSPVGLDELRALAGRIADIVLDVLNPNGPGPEHAARLLTDSLPPLGTLDAVTFSGGVAEYIYGREATTFGDLGLGIGAAIRERLAQIHAARGIPLRSLPVGIRATVMGTSRHTLRLSGETVVVAPPELLPMRNVPVVAVPPTPATVADPGTALASRIAHALETRGLTGETPVAVAIDWDGPATFERLDRVCRELLAGIRREPTSSVPVVLITNQDVGGLLGLHLTRELGIPNVVSLDGLLVDDYDFLDIGGIAEGTGAVPVVVKSMLFPIDHRGARGS